MTELENAIRCQQLRQTIAHTIIHRMSLWQWIFKGGWWRKEYDKASEELVRLEKESKNVTQES